MCPSSPLRPSITRKTFASDYLDQLNDKHLTDFRLQCTLEYARSNLRHDLSLRRLATITNVSPSHICRLFRDELGISPARCVKLLRLKCAANLLVHTPLSVKEVMASVGINDASHFVRDFRGFTGEFPAEYRSRIRKQETANGRCPQYAKIGQ